MNVIWRNSVSCLRIRKVPHRYQSGNHPAAPLGSRILTDPAKVFEHNMWDHMQWSKEEEAAARKRVEENSAVRVLLEEQVKYENEASQYWDTFYKVHKNKFFKDRNWLLREFPEIIPVDQKTEEKTQESSWDNVKTGAANCFSRMHCPIMPEEKNLGMKRCGSSDGPSRARSHFSNLDSEEHSEGPLKTELFPGSSATFRILEVGCGAGNSVFPILNTLQNAPESFLYCCDFASRAVELVKLHSSYRAAQCCAFVHDVCDEDSPYPFPDGILDVILLVFVLSSIHPDRMQGVINRLSKLLKPGGMLLFRDYGRYDKTQLRFKRGHCLSENFYVRGDGTRAYFFTKGEVHTMFCKAGLDEKQNLVDRRLQVNRKKQVKMHRVWVQGKFQKPLHLTQKPSKLVSPLLSHG
ncbi:tRNA N(3)-methylcytidine methyltransferase METTL8, mitochondrial isoform X2 [Panthera pardus]|nr:tRNA N(3)-methylcytidine methyltransferase METTL8, mitochondrial isoform X2 [Panthera pardus]XP_053763708.1 tRNA N(3)-methylcytidine methyltransferase METTL8, mitochondrial isoform X2 [Panthera pardus]XP_053763713.1 tRNA N(3)-methylcytidine methyltransferase METTL8, mitochondrial isoform X2 [Panthera pardus]